MDIFHYLCTQIDRTAPMKILWLDLNSSYAHASLALPALHAQQDTASPTEWEVVSATINENPGPVVEQIHDRQPDIVAATAWLFNHETLLHIVARVKALLPHCCLVLGGPEFLDDNESYLRRHPYVDCVFRGEGEEVFHQWLACKEERQAWRHIPGLCYIDPESDAYVDNGTARVRHFDKLAPPEASRFFNWSKPFVQLETTRGCFNTCAFCVSGGEKPVRLLPIESIAQRLDCIRQHGIRDVRILDRTFNYNASRARALLELFRSYHPALHFHLEIHPALLTEELKSLLAGMPAGLLHLEAGIQSLHEDVLETCGRKGGLKDSLSGLQFLCSLSNVVTHADLIAGLPRYSLPQIFADVRALASYRAGEIQLESLKVLPGTEMKRRAAGWGLSYSPLPPYEVLKTPDITPAELQTSRRLSRLLDGYYNTSAWQEVTRCLILHDENFLHIFLDELVRQGVIDQPLSLERRGILLYDFCQKHYPDFTLSVSQAWIEAGLSLKKKPAERIKTKRQVPPECWEVLKGFYKPSLRLYFLPADETGEQGYWYGYESERQEVYPVFKAKSILHKD